MALSRDATATHSHLRTDPHSEIFQNTICRRRTTIPSFKHKRKEKFLKFIESKEGRVTRIDSVNYETLRVAQDY